jgi:hypothetical protein
VASKTRRSLPVLEFRFLREEGGNRIGRLLFPAVRGANPLGSLLHDLRVGLLNGSVIEVVQFLDADRAITLGV